MASLMEGQSNAKAGTSRSDLRWLPVRCDVRVDRFCDMVMRTPHPLIERSVLTDAMRPKLEVCVETLRGAESASRGGADRIELCGTLADGGVSPSLGVLEQVLAAVTIPVHCMIRPRGGDFCYSQGELLAMERDIRVGMVGGAGGFVLGGLTSKGVLDGAVARRMIELARPMRVTFHRAFDVTRDLERSLDDVIEAGADILLTSGGARRLSEAVDVVAALVERAGTRIEVMGGSGVSVASAAELCEATGLAAIHGSFRRQVPYAADAHVLPDALPGYELYEEDVRAVAGALSSLAKASALAAGRST